LLHTAGLPIIELQQHTVLSLFYPQKFCILVTTLAKVFANYIISIFNLCKWTDPKMYIKAYTCTS